MNRFRTKKKAKEDTSGRHHVEEQSSMPSFKGFRRGKRSHEEEPKKEIDLTAALPSDDNFRTSLLMTGLSARFSMLREQDDPHTKIGKASDDSVLFPKRQSRLLEYGFGAGGLADIAEVESIKAPRSFARIESYASDDADSTKGSSIMNRSKPTEGNNLFGGRQKIYKIPVGQVPKGAPGVMSGKALYEDDVAQSAFQKWRQAERERKTSFEYEDKDDVAESRHGEFDPYRSESPPPAGYNRKRETSSTTSSTPSLARNSTAATSVVSQPTASVKDWQSQSAAPSPASSTPVAERNVTRTRRLYEQGLNQDLHEQQTSALSRIDTLSGKRMFGSRTPDLSQSSASPTSAFSERFGGPDRRPILSKASAPNLRSISPPATASSVSTMDLPPIKPPAGLGESRTNFIGTPPLSPPISEAGEYPILPIQPNDRGKATAMGVFQKPAQPYDESKYAQRQLQLQQGRETPTQRFRAESNASYATGRSRSSSANQNQNELSIKTDVAPKMDFAVRSTFLDADDESPIINEPLRSAARPPAPLQRPSDEDHPAFRQSAMPTPLSVTSKISGEPSPLLVKPDLSVNGSQQPSPEDSPTLGPASGLSGMVRQHLRSESNTSSIYGGAPQSGDLESRFTMDGRNNNMFQSLEVKPLGNPWSEQDWNLSVYGAESVTKKDVAAAPAPTAPEPEKQSPVEEPTAAPVDTSPADTPSNRSSDNMDKEEEDDDFANQLANARRRVQERLTTYVESDSSRSASPLLPPSDPPTQPPRSNPLGILRGKSSRGSLMERSREPSQSKAMKMLGIGASTMSTSPSPSKPAFDDSLQLAEAEEEQTPAAPVSDSPDAAREEQPSSESVEPKEEDSENMHPGLRAFRQARRELQKRKELEVMARHQPGEHKSPNHTSPARERDTTPIRDRKPPPVFYQQRAPSEESNGRAPGSRPGSRPPSRSDRDRSGSDASTGRSQSRPGRLRNNSSAYDEKQGQLGPNGSAPRPAMLRSPGLPGTDIRRSPLMPPQGYPGGSLASPRAMDRSASSGNLTVQGGRAGYENLSGQPSPISPLSVGLPPSPFMGSANNSGATTPTGVRRPSAPPTPNFNTMSTLNESMKKIVNKNDISEPTFIMSTSRVPTVSLPQGMSSPEGSRSGSRSRSASRSRSNSNAGYAPPLPPINPLRKREPSRTRGMLGAFMGRKGEGEDAASVSTPHLPLGGSSSALGGGGMGYGDEVRSTFSASDDEDEKSSRRWLRKQTSEASGLGSRAPARKERNVSPPFVAGPPASRTVVAQTARSPPSMGMPGGMI